MNPPPPFPLRGTRDAVEHGAQLQPKFDEHGLIPCITQDVATGEVLMFAFMNAESLAHTLRTGKATYWSRSRGQLWVKGEESGNVQWVRELRTDCDQDVILLRVEQAGLGAACHNGYESCFYRRLRNLDTESDLALEFVRQPKFDPKAVYRK
jgi:phosphoribosyl-AMP cyclohydrolase